MAIDRGGVAKATRDLLEALGVAKDSETWNETPRRVAQFWIEFLEHEPGNTDRTFAVDHTDQLVMVSGVKVWSLCEHHLLPFNCDVAVGYLVSDRAIGLSKIARIAHKHAHRLQMQERLVEGIASEMVAVVGPDVAVLGSGEHLCTAIRGVRTPAVMTTSVMRGKFRADSTLRAEFMSLIQRRSEGFR